jgi:nucleoside-diphosphate-sugar epimerase
MNFEPTKLSERTLKIIVAGGDGFVGWPLALRLSNIGH